MTIPNRRQSITQKVKTAFGSMYVIVDFDNAGYPIGGKIHTPEKEPDSQITMLISQLSHGLNQALVGYARGK